jgi:hypothetical protein
MVRGRFSELWWLRDLPERDFFSSYLATCLECDVRQILNVASLRDFERFIRLAAARSGAVLNKSDIARDPDVSVKAVEDWLSVLQASGQIVLPEPWYCRDQRAREIDLVIETRGRLSFVECRWKENPRKDDARTITAVSGELARSGSACSPPGTACWGPTRSPTRSARASKR